ncbi:MAG: AAA family ATPase [Acidiferrobacterales bacterium]
MGTGIDAIRRMLERSTRVQQALVKNAFLPNRTKTNERRWSITEAAELVGRTQQAIREAESSGRLPSPDMDKNNRRRGYSLEAMNKMRDLFGTRPWRAPNEEPVVLAISNFKGGVAKTTIACNLVQFLAIRGYRVLIIDMDPQASATSTFGYIPDADIKDDETTLPYLRGERKSLAYAIRRTYWDGLDLIPSNLNLFNVEYEMAASFSGSSLDLLHDGVQAASVNYDVVVIDSPPALGMLSLNVLRAANALVIPIPPAMYDFYSTVSYLRMLDQVLSTMDKALTSTEYKFVKMLISRLDERKPAHTEMMAIMESTYESMLLKTKLKESAEINNAAVRLYTVYELDKAERSKESRTRALLLLDSVFGEIEEEILKCWPSRVQNLRERGLVA